MSASTIGRAVVHRVFVVPETTKGTAAFVSDTSTQQVLCTEAASITQAVPKSNNEEMNGTRDYLQRFVDKKAAGSWTVPMYLRPSGSPGSVPMGHDLYEALFGTETINDSTSVVYSQLLQDKPSFTIWQQRGNVVNFAVGCTANELGISLSGSGALKVQMSGGLMNRGWAGVSPLATAITTASVTSVVVDDASVFTVGSRIWNKTQELDNSEAGWTVTAVSVGTNTLTVTPAIDGSGVPWTLDDEIAGYLPAAGTAIGTPINEREIALTVGGATVIPTAFDITINDGVSYIENEKGGDYPTDYIEGMRSISGTIAVNMRQGDAKFLYDAENSVSRAINLVIGETSGYIATLALPYCDLDMPEISTDAPVVSLNFGFVAQGGSGEDSATFTLT